MTTRSWWGWGSTEEAVSSSESAQLLSRIAEFLPGADLAPHVAPDPRDLGLRAPRVTAPSALGGLCSTDPIDRAGHTHGKAFRDVVRNLHGRLDNPPDLVVRPRTEQDVVDVLDWCSGDGVAVIPYGGGSSVVGGIEPRFDGPAVTLDLGRLDRVLEIDRTSRAARIQAGVLGPAARGPAAAGRGSPCGTSRSRSRGPRSAGGWRREPAATSRPCTRTSTTSPSRCGS